MTYADILTQEREKAGISKYRLSQITGVPESTIGRIEKGRMKPNIEMYAKLIEALGKRLVIE